MAKRFTDTDKWKKPFIKGLPVAYKLLWFYMLDDCDLAGLWQVDLEVAELRLGVKLDRNEAIQAFNDQIVILDVGDKWFIPSFIEFQYGSQLSKTNNIFNSIDKILRKHDLYKYLSVEVTETGTTISAMRGRISKKIKDKIYLEANLICQYCQEQKTITELVVDHFIPLIKGGDNSDENLVCACIRCNSYKTDFLPDEFIARNLPFINPTEKILKLLTAFNSLKGGIKDLLSPKDKDKDKEQDKVKDKDKEQEQISGNGFEYHLKKVEQAVDSMDEKLKEYDAWTTQIIEGNDQYFEQMFTHESIPAGDHIQFWIMDHRDLLNRYPKMRPPTQDAFRKSCLKHIRENYKKPTNGKVINKKQQQSDNTSEYLKNYYAEKISGSKAN